jgi:TetR/AcrR family transcriptional regulator
MTLIHPATPKTAIRQGRQSDEASEHTKEVIIKAALNEFAERGFEGASLRDIASRAGTTHGLIRHHFGSKDTVFRACVDYAVEVYGREEASVIQNVPANLDNPKLLIEAHKKIIRNFAHVSAKNPFFMQILMHEGSQQTERLEYIFQKIALLNEQHQTFFNRLSATGVLEQFDKNSCFLFVLTNLGLVFGLTAVSSQYVGGNILSDKQVEAHADRIIATLYPEK